MEITKITTHAFPSNEKLPKRCTLEMDISKFLVYLDGNLEKEHVLLKLVFENPKASKL